MALPFAKIILSRMTAELKPRGFRKNGQTFVRKVDDETYQIVNLQASQWGTKDSQQYTVNLSVYCARLQPLTKDGAKLKASSGHWRARIGKFTDSPRDVWWEVRSEGDAQKAAEEIVSLLPKALSRMDPISSYEALIRIPMGVGGGTENPPGWCYRRLIDEAKEREGLQPSIEN